MAVDFFNLQSHTSKKLMQVSVLCATWKEQFSSFRSRRLKATEDATQIMPEPDQNRLSSTGIRCGTCGLGSQLVRWGGVCACFTVHKKWEPEKPRGPKQSGTALRGTAALQKQAWKL